MVVDAVHYLGKVRERGHVTQRSVTWGDFQVTAAQTRELERSAR